MRQFILDACHLLTPGPFSHMSKSMLQPLGGFWWRQFLCGGFLRVRNHPLSSGLHLGRRQSPLCLSGKAALVAGLRVWAGWWVPLGDTPSLIFLTLSPSASSHTLWPQEMEKDHKPDPALTGKEHSQPAKFCFLNDSPEHLLYFLHKKNSKTWSLPSRRIQSSWKGWVHVHMYKHTRMLAHAHANACTHAHTPSRGTW